MGFFLGDIRCFLFIKRLWIWIVLAHLNLNLRFKCLNLNEIISIFFSFFFCKTMSEWYNYNTIFILWYINIYKHYIRPVRCTWAYKIRENCCWTITLSTFISSPCATAKSILIFISNSHEDPCVAHGLYISVHSVIFDTYFRYYTSKLWWYHISKHVTHLK